MTTLNINLSDVQNTQLHSFFDQLRTANHSNANYRAMVDALQFGTIEEVSLTPTRYEVKLYGTGYMCCRGRSSTAAAVLI